jgi:hypothetical protein
MVFMGLFDKLFNDDDKEKEEAAKRKAAEKYAEEHNHAHGDAEHEHAPAKKTAVKKAAPAKKPAAKAAAVKAATAKPAAKAAAGEEHVHLHSPSIPNPRHASSSTAAMTAAHDQTMTLHLLSHVPDHAPREEDPHYHLFEQAKARLKRQGLWKCVINDELCDGDPELHHTYIEFSQINQVDPDKIEKSLGLHFQDDEEFQVWAESPGNLEVLCVAHHRAHYGIHVIPGPLWEALRFRKKGSQAAAEFVPSDDN